MHKNTPDLFSASLCAHTHLLSQRPASIATPYCFFLLFFTHSLSLCLSYSVPPALSVSLSPLSVFILLAVSHSQSVSLSLFLFLIPDLSLFCLYYSLSDFLAPVSFATIYLSLHVHSLSLCLMPSLPIHTCNLTLSQDLMTLLSSSHWTWLDWSVLVFSVGRASSARAHNVNMTQSRAAH